MAVKRGLGKGVDSLIPVRNTENKTTVKTNTKEKISKEQGTPLKVKISKVEPNRNQPRKAFNEDALLELEESIKQYGIISPLIVKEKGDYYEIIAGERRWRAAKNAGLKEVPVIINNDYSDEQSLEIAIIENIQRKDLNPIEEALAYKRLTEEFNLTQDEVAEKVSKSRAEVTNKIRLLKLDKRVQEMLISESIENGHARALIKVEDADKQYELALKVMDEKLTVREVEAIVKNLGKEKTVKKIEVDEQYKLACQEASQRMTNVIGTKVNINQSKKKGKGKIEIEYYSQDDLDRIMNMILSLS